MKFSYDDIQSGSAICRLELNGQEFIFHPSFFSDALGDFVTYLASVHPLCKLGWKEGAFGYFKGGITWNMDSVLLCWEFKRDFEDLTITINELQNSMVSRKKDSKYPNQLLKTTCNFNEFVLCVVKELNRIINQRGILGYRQEWRKYTFPIDGFLALKHACLYNKPFEITKKNSGTTLEDELTLLMKEI